MPLLFDYSIDYAKIVVSGRTSPVEILSVCLFFAKRLLIFGVFAFLRPFDHSLLIYYQAGAD